MTCGWGLPFSKNVTSISLVVLEQRRFDDLEEKAEVFRQSITMCHMSRVPCHMSRVRCPVSGVQVTFSGESGGTSR